MKFKNYCDSYQNVYIIEYQVKGDVIVEVLQFIKIYM
jgi:hypothetical protein